MTDILSKILGQHIAVLGKTGSGKTSTEKLLIEHVVAQGFRVCVLDTIKSDWWGITSSGDGKKPGLDFKILGGPRGHVPLHANAGKVIGQLVGSGKLRHSIIDMADFEAGGIQKFFVEFAQSLWRNVRGVVYLVIEEAHEVAPKERAGWGSENLSIHWAKKLATGSRTKGIRLITGTQRVQALHNAVLGSMETLIAHRITTPADQEPVLKWLKSNTNKETTDKVALTLSSQPTGTGWVCAGEAKVFEQVAFPKFSTYDNTATPTGDSPEVAVKTAPVNQEELASIIGEAVEEAKANDPTELKRTISQLRRELTQAQKAQPVTATAKESNTKELRAQLRLSTHLLDQVMKFIVEISTRNFGQEVTNDEIKDAVAKAVERAMPAIQSKLDQRKESLDKLKRMAEQLLESVKKQRAEKIPINLDVRHNEPFSVSPTPSRTPVVSRTAAPFLNGDFRINPAQQRILNSLAWYESIGITQPTNLQIGAVALIDSTGGHFSNLVGPLSTNGLVERGGGYVHLTNEGRKHASVPDNVATLDDYHEMLRRRVLKVKSSGGKTVAILNAVISRGGQDMTTEEIGQAVSMDHTGGHFSNMIGPLGTLGLIERRQGIVRPTEILFPKTLA